MTMPRQKKITRGRETRKAILIYIRSHNTGALTSEIAKYLNVSSQTVMSHIKGLMAEELVKRIPEGTGYRYFHRKFKDEDMKPIPRLPKETIKYTVDLEPEDIFKFLTKWQDKWEPRIFVSARNLPIGLARLFELAIEDAYGSVVSDKDIDEIRYAIEQFRHDLISTLRVVNGMLDERNLWNRHKFTQVTLRDLNIDEVKSIAFKVKQAN